MGADSKCNLYLRAIARLGGARVTKEWVGGELLAEGLTPGGWEDGGDEAGGVRAVLRDGVCGETKRVSSRVGCRKGCNSRNFGAVTDGWTVIDDLFTRVG